MAWTTKPEEDQHGLQLLQFFINSFSRFIVIVHCHLILNI